MVPIRQLPPAAAEKEFRQRSHPSPAPRTRAKQQPGTGLKGKPPRPGGQRHKYLRHVPRRRPLGHRSSKACLFQFTWTGDAVPCGHCRRVDPRYRRRRPGTPKLDGRGELICHGGYSPRTGPHGPELVVFLCAFAELRTANTWKTNPRTDPAARTSSTLGQTRSVTWACGVRRVCRAGPNPRFAQK